MSEYMQPVKRPKTLNDLDHTGTLFEVLPTAPDEETPVTPPSIVSVQRSQRHVEHRYPLTTEEYRARVARRIGRQAIDTAVDRPYHDLGGHIPSTFAETVADPFETLVEQCAPWMCDIRLVIDRYGLAELTRAGLADMTQPDRRALALHFDGFMTRLKAAHRLIGAADGDVTAYPLLERRYGKRSPEEMIAYLPILEELYEVLQYNDAARELTTIAHTISPFPDKREKMRRRDDDAHGYPRVYFNGVKPRIEREQKKKSS